MGALDTPEGYTEPVFIWLVEFVDPREPHGDTFQLGAFITEQESLRLKERLEHEGFPSELRINMVPVHRRLEDWLWDR